jgi:2-phospho-L-lactate guanylyltransferase (CobY/MobA/RfbA family)
MRQTLAITRRALTHVVLHRERRNLGMAMAGNAMARRDGLQHRRFALAALDGEGTAGMEMAARGRRDRVGNVADLPLLTPNLLRHFTRSASSPVVRVAADRHNAGTNALYLQPPRSDMARFGNDSLQKHRSVAHARGIRLEVVRERALAFDVDVPTDLSETGLI